MRAPRNRHARGAVLALGLAATVVGCGGSGVEVRRVETIYASWSVEEVDVRRGEVRIAGPVDVDESGSDLEIVNPCSKRPLGRGVWTRNRLVWRLTTDDVAVALACRGTLGLVARSKNAAPGVTAGISSAVQLRLEVVDETSVDGMGSMYLAHDGVGTTVEVRAEEPARLRLAFSGEVTGPSSADEASARFQVPTASLVAAALRRGDIRVSGSGERETRGRLVVFVGNTEVAPPPPDPVATEGESATDG